MKRITPFYVTIDDGREPGLYYKAVIGKNKFVIKECLANDIYELSDVLMGNDAFTKIYKTEHDLTNNTFAHNVPKKVIFKIYKGAINKYGIKALPFLPVESLGEEYEDEFLEYCKESSKEERANFSRKANITYADISFSNRKIRENDYFHKSAIQKFENDLTEHKAVRKDFNENMKNSDGKYIELI